MKYEERILARKYGQAFINISRGTLDEQQVQQLEQAAQFLRYHTKALIFAQQFKLDPVAEKNALTMILKQFSVLPQVYKLLDLLIEHKRLALLPAVLEQIVALYKAYNNSMDFTVVSSHPLSQDMVQALQHYLTYVTGKKVTLSLKIDARLIAGIRFYSDTLGWEHSIRQQLKRMSRMH